MLQEDLNNYFKKIKREEDLRNLIKDKVKEDLHLEFKTKTRQQGWQIRQF